MALPPTPSQTVGPFFHIGTDDGFIGGELVAPDHPDAVRAVRRSCATARACR